MEIQSCTNENSWFHGVWSLFLKSKIYNWNRVLEGASCSQHRTSIGDIGGIFVVDYIISGFIRFQDQLKAMENYTCLKWI